MMSYKPSNEITLASLTDTLTDRKKAEDDYCTLSGRTVLVTSREHIKADISAARNILSKLLAEKKAKSVVSSVKAVAKRGGTVG